MLQDRPRTFGNSTISNFGSTATYGTNSSYGNSNYNGLNYNNGDYNSTNFNNSNFGNSGNYSNTNYNSGNYNNSNYNNGNYGNNYNSTNRNYGSGAESFTKMNFSLHKKENTPTKENLENKYSVGKKVTHPKFGNGTITSNQGINITKCVSINFENFGIKTLSVEYAPITLL